MARSASVLLMSLAVGCAATGSGASHQQTAALIPVPVPAPAPSRPAPHLRILLGGDLLPHRPQLNAPSSVGTALTPLLPLFRQGNAVIANYETATGDANDLKPRTLSLAASPEWAAAVRSAGIDAVTVANNHTCDLGREGLDATLEATSAVGMVAIGAGDAPWAPRVVAELDGKKVCVVAWTTISNDRSKTCAGSSALAIAPEDAHGMARVTRAIMSARPSCDAIIAVFHGGEEYSKQTQRSVAMGVAAAEGGAAAIVIHHPHVVSGLLLVTTRDGRRVPIFSSLGNLVSNQGESWDPRFPARQPDRRIVYMNGWTRLGMIADLSVGFAGKTPELRWGYHLVWTDNEHGLDKSNPNPLIATRLLDDETDRGIISKLSSDRTGPVSVFTEPCRLRGAALPSCL